MRKYAVILTTLLLGFVAMPAGADTMPVDEAAFTPNVLELLQETPPAQEAAGQAQEATEEMAGEAQEAAEEMAGEAQEAAEEVAGEAQEAAEEVAGEAQEAAEEMAPAGDGGATDWYWILGLAAAFIIVWMVLRKRRAARQG